MARENRILDEGNPNCEHEFIDYVDNKFDGQAFWCDMSDCNRHERIGYSPGHVMEFPSGSYIRNPNPKFGIRGVYSHKADENGIASLLDEVNRLIKVETEDGGVEFSHYEIL